MRRPAVLLATLLLASCNRTAQPERDPGPTAPLPSATAGPAPATEAPIERLTMSPEDVVVDREQVVYSATARRKVAQQIQYLFAKDDFAAKVGTLKPEKPVHLMIQVTRTMYEKYFPVDDEQAPVGGYDITRYRCRIVAVGL